MYKGYSKRAHPGRRRLMRRRIRTFRAWIAAGVVCVLCGSQAYCASVTLAWDPSPDSDVAGYNLSYGPSTHNYTNVVDVGDNTSFSLFGLVIGATYFMAVTAYNNLGVESPPSDEVVYTVPNRTYAPRFQIGTWLSMTNGSFNFALGTDPGQQIVVQSSTDLVHWVSISTNTASGINLNFTDPAATNLIRVFRALLLDSGISQPASIPLQLLNPLIK